MATSKAMSHQVFGPTSGAPSVFSLVVDDFWVKYVGEEHAAHLISSLKETYKLEIDTEGNNHVGISRLGLPEGRGPFVLAGMCVLIPKPFSTHLVEKTRGSAVCTRGT